MYSIILEELSAIDFTKLDEKELTGWQYQSIQVTGELYNQILQGSSHEFLNGNKAYVFGPLFPTNEYKIRSKISITTNKATHKTTEPNSHTTTETDLHTTTETDSYTTPLCMIGFIDFDEMKKMSNENEKKTGDYREKIEHSKENMPAAIKEVRKINPAILWIESVNDASINLYVHKDYESNNIDSVIVDSGYFFDGDKDNV